MTIRLGALEIQPGSRSALVNGVGVELGSRAFDLLMVLVNAHGEIVSKESIMAQVWPTTTVVDSNLKVQLSVLRRALGAERWRIKTVSGRGYLLVLNDTPSEDEPQHAPRAAEYAGTGKPLVIVVDADPAAQVRLMRAVQDIAESLDGISRLSLLPGGYDARTLFN